MDDLSDQSAKDSWLFFSGSRQCKCWSTSSDKSLSTNPPSTVEIPPKFSSLAGAHYAGLLQIFFHSNIFVCAWAICIINCNVTGRYGLYISHFSLLEMSVIIQKLLLQVISVLLLVFYIGKITGLPSPSELTGMPRILRWMKSLF